MPSARLFEWWLLMVEIDIEAVKGDLGYLSRGDHMGDVNNVLPSLCEHLGLPKPTWCDPFDHFVMAWDADEHASDYTDHICEVTRMRDG